jgi:hypothetical protein
MPRPSKARLFVWFGWVKALNTCVIATIPAFWRGFVLCVLHGLAGVQSASPEKWGKTLRLDWQIDP